MPIRPTTIVDIREQIARMALSGKYSIAEIARLFDISRPTVYDYRQRFEVGGREALKDRSRCPHWIHRIDAAIHERIVEERVQFGFGAKKIRRRMLDEDPHGKWPARSTIEQILHREGLVRSRRRRQRHASPFKQQFQVTAPSQLNTIDFKGEFRLRDGRWCRPLTMVDAFSRYLLACEALPSIRLELAWPVVERVFREHGLPDAVLSDNGSPFGGHGAGRFSIFSVRLMELGIQPVFIAPGHPEQNGSHERMHRTLLESPLFERSTSFRRQQQLFDSFQHVYNFERPHEGIEMDRPAQRFQPSGRAFPKTIPRPEYPSTFHVRRVNRNGHLKWRGRWVWISECFRGRDLGLELIDEELWNVYFGTFLIGRFDETERRLV